MKILAIRGKNLASLARQFELDFNDEPLASTGIFAITGPTGAGKSTLLDALCLALYDDMPRLPREGTRQQLPDVSGETIAPRDPRNILRRGAAEGFAEVDFVGNDGLAYRAHWSVRRAHGRSGGRLQASEMSLLSLSDTQIIASTRKIEVLEAITARIGLSFEQFTRAVLLAQNEFSTFLKASDDKRAELLQTLTGTDLFADLSRRAYQRAKGAEQSLANLRASLASLLILSSEEREQKQLASSQAQLQVKTLEAERLQLEQQLQWYQQAAQLVQACQQAELALATTRTAEQAATERRHFLAKVEAVQALGSLVENIQWFKQALGHTAAKLQTAEQHCFTAQQGQQLIQTQLLAAQAQLKAKQQDYASLQPELLQARQLDTLIQALMPRHKAACLAQQMAEEVLNALQTQAAQQVAKLEHVQQHHHKLKVWLAEHTHLQGLAEHWPHWQSLLQQAQASLHQQAAAECELMSLTHSVEQLQLSLEQAKQAWQGKQQQLTQAEAAYQQARQQAACYDLEHLAKQRQTLEGQALQLQAAQQAGRAVAMSTQVLVQLQAELQQVHTAQQQCEQTCQQLSTRLQVIERDGECAEHAWRLAEAACNDQAAHWRVSLQDGDACPVCGATEHPYAQQVPALDAVLARLQQDYLQQRQAAKVLTGRVNAEQTSLQHYQQQYLGLEQRLRTAIAAKDLAETEWQSYSFLGMAVDSAFELEQQLQTNQQALSAIHLAEQAARNAYQQRELAQQAQSQAQQLSAAAQDKYNTTENKLKLQQAQQYYLQQSQVELAARLQAMLVQLNAAFVDSRWQAAWQGSAANFMHQCAMDVQAWQTQQQTEHQLSQDSTELLAAQTQLSFQVQQAQETLGRRQQQLTQLFVELQAQQQERQGLRIGDSTVAFERSWQLELEQLARQVKALQASAEHANHAQIRCAETLLQLQTQLQQQQSQQRASQQILATELAAVNQQGFSVDEAELDALLAYEPTWLQRERQALQDLHTACTKAQAILTERQTQWEQHEQLRPDAANLAAVQTTYASKLVDLQTTQLVAQELLLILREDRQRREQASSLQTELDHLTSQARIWGQLNELIGSASGNKFRDVAQQYSLDVLLGYANRHLADLSQRYTLRRVQRSLALLVLDQDMGGEIRSVHSLSGGESFLVSLALALGLASLSSQRVKVESLFIDEGFGSLDADSLRVAMDALDQLQAQGRKVGVISHVQEMTERIAVQIQVKRLSGGQSYVKVSGH